AGKALALARGSYLDFVTNLKRRNFYPGADLHIQILGLFLSLSVGVLAGGVNVGESNLAKHFRGGIGGLEVPHQRSADLLGVAKPELHGVVSVGIASLQLGDDARTGLNNG